MENEQVEYKLRHIVACCFYCSTVFCAIIKHFSYLISTSLEQTCKHLLFFLFFNSVRYSSFSLSACLFLIAVPVAWAQQEMHNNCMSHWSITHNTKEMHNNRKTLWPFSPTAIWQEAKNFSFLCIFFKHLDIDIILLLCVDYWMQNALRSLKYCTMNEA